MPFETPPLRVSRPVAACAPCRRTKSKCDGKLPVCSSCEKSRKADQCSSNMTDARETSYVATLEARKALLDKAMAESRARRKSMISVIGTIDSRRASAAEWRASKRRAEGKKEATTVDDLVGDFGLMSISATTRDFYGFTPETSYSKFVLYSSANDEALPNPSMGDNDLPPREDIIRLIQSYLEGPWRHLPIVDEATIWASVHNISNSQASCFEHFIVRLILAISLTTSHTAAPKDAAAYEGAHTHLAGAMGYSALVLRPGSVTSIQALLLLSQYSMLDGAHFDHWALVGLAARATVDIGMHHDAPKSANVPKAELDLRRRVFWCLYALDRVAAMLHARPLSFSDAAVSVALPLPGSSTPAISLALFRLRRLQSGMYAGLYQRSMWEPSASIAAAAAAAVGEAAEAGAAAVAGGGGGGCGGNGGGDDGAWAFVWSEYARLREWLDATLPLVEPGSGAARALEAEYCFSCAFLLAPSPRCPARDAHAEGVRAGHAARLQQLLGEGGGGGGALLFYGSLVAAWLQQQ